LTSFEHVVSPQLLPTIMIRMQDDAHRAVSRVGICDELE
jgi:hypothetical protein